jgi:hypothetical protein
MGSVVSSRSPEVCIHILIDMRISLIPPGPAHARPRTPYCTISHLLPMTDAKKTAGGRATEAGMAFQAAVATWFATQLLADMPIGARFGIPSSLKIVGLQCETGDALDDVVVRLDDGGAIYAQCKTRPSLTTGADSLLAKALNQLVDLYVQRGPAALVVATANAALLAVAEDAPRSLDTLEAGCRMFDHGGVWDVVIAQAPGDRRDALALFETHVRRAWARRMASPLAGDALVAMARLFHIQRFAEDASGTTWRETSHLLGRRLFGGDDAGDAPMAALLGLSRKFIRTGAPVDRAGLLRALRAEGHVDVSAPAYDKDIAALLAYSDDERSRLRKHTCLPLGEGIPVQRDCLEPLLDAVAGGNLLVTGEPGAGKTGVLLSLAERLAREPGPLLFLSVERFSGFTLRSNFRTELRLDHDPVEVLAAWPAAEPGVLIIDALDASRGGPSEPVIAAFIADAVEKVGARWSIVASIRTFDLRNGQRFREIVPVTPPNRGFVEKAWTTSDTSTSRVCRPANSPLSRRRQTSSMRWKARPPRNCETCCATSSIYPWLQNSSTLASKPSPSAPSPPSRS